MTYGIYKGLRDAAWQCLIDHKADKLPVDVVGIARESGIRVIKNSAVGELQGNESGLSFLDGKQWYIVYDDTNTIERCRFTVAHELGHIFLGHEMKQGYVARTSLVGIKPEIEREADMFASRILCPSCVLWALDLHTPEEISQACKVSYTAAKIRAERMAVLYERQKFLTSPLERKVLRNFKEYIKSVKNKKPPSG